MSTATVVRLRPNAANSNGFHLELATTDAEDVNDAIARKATFHLVWD